MNDRDPLRRQIHERLSGELNPQTFEAAVCDLLRDTFPSLVPVQGGSDAGRDGAIADGVGEAFPLICTTARDVIRNLTRSLDSYLKHGGRRRHVVLATSRKLTPQRRLNLEQRAREKGFELIQIIDQNGIADRLYRDEHWRHELLGIAGTPAALSAVPLSKRPFLELSPVGRDEDLSWVRTTTGDRVLSGQPGSGKTFLLQHLIREGWPGLFLVSRDRTEIANALRAQQAPGLVVIVDDAHAELERLVLLRQLRSEIESDFTILATTWEGNLDSVVETLGSTVATHRLELLTRLEILEVYRQAGITEENTDRELLRDLVDQASNRPGLAATLALLWLRGGWREVLSGKALGRHVRETFRSLIGADAAPLLAAFAIGGDRGMALTSVSELLGLSLSDIWRQTAALSAGGALSPIEREVLAVRPYQLRSALLWTVFFPDSDHGPALPYRPFLDRAPSRGSAATAFVQAKLDGVPIPNAELRDLVSRADRPDTWRSADILIAWQGLALSSPENARWVVEHYPGDALHLAYETLQQAPHAIIPLLLGRAFEFGDSFRSRHDHPLRILERWIQEPLKAPPESIRRRRLLIQEIVIYLRHGDPSIGLHALALALSPKLEESSFDPGLGNRVEFSWGLLPIGALRELGNLWTEVRDQLPPVPLEAWPPLASVLWELIDPEHIAPEGSVTEETVRLLHDLAASVIRDLAPLVRTSPGLTSELRLFAERLGLSIDLPLDQAFELFFPKDDSAPEVEPEPEALTELVSAWSQESPHEIARRLAIYEREARHTARHWPRYTPRLCRELAARIDAPAEWLSAWAEKELPADLAEPFLQEILRRRPEGWDSLLEAWLGFDLWNGTVASLLGAVPDLPPHLTERTLSCLEAQPQLIYHLALRGEIGLSTVQALLRSPHPETALAAAAGSWSADPRGTVSQGLAEDWQHAILRSGAEIEERRLQYGLAQILKSDPSLALEWLRACIQAGAIPLNLSRPSLERGPFRTALSVLNVEQRRTLLADLVPAPGVRGLLPHLIGRDAALYGQLLKRTDLRDDQLVPLQGRPDSEWIPLALAAVEHGWEAREIASAAVFGPSIPVFWGSEASHWAGWQSSFAALEADPNPAIRPIGKAGQDLVRPWMNRAQKEERQETLDGLR